jgi:CRISPR-associated protein Csd2
LARRDLVLFWEALQNMFEHDRSAARGQMATRGLYVFEHESKLGNASAHSLFERVVVRQKDAEKPARSFSDFEVCLNSSGTPAGVQLHAKV